MAKKDKENKEVKDLTVEEGKAPEDIIFRFRENRSFDLHIGREVYRFEGTIPRTLTRAILDHKDWTKQVANKFTIKEV
jgi:hypothetical protein